MDRIDCLRAFVRSLEGGSFSVAANELGIGQPAVSKRIALLEGEFGTQLFFRTTRKLKPTPEGHRIYDLARQILGSFDLAKANVEENSLRPSGTLRVSVPSSFGRRYLMPVIDDADAMEAAVMQHLGIAILPEWSAVAGIRSGKLENLLPDFSIAALPLHAVYPETHWMSLRARSFLDLLIKRSGQFSTQF